MSFTDIFIRRPVLASVVSLFILLVGLQCAFKLQVRQYPRALLDDDHHHDAHIQAPTRMSSRATSRRPIAQAVASAEGIDTLVSNSQQNASTITLNLLLNANADRAVADVLSKVNQVKYLLPREALDPVVVKQTGDSTALLYMSFNSKVMTPSQITDYLTRVVQPKLQTIDGVANAQILGGQTFAMRVWLDPNKMAARGVTPNDVRLALAANNFTAAAGQVKGDFVQTSINAQTSLDSAQGVRRTGGLGAGRRADPARRDRRHRAWTRIGRFLFRVRRAEGRLHRHLCDADRQSARRHHPRARGVSRAAKRSFRSVSTRRSPMTRRSSSAPRSMRSRRRLAEAAIVVILVIFLFLGSLRATIIPIVTIPLSLVGVMIILLALGYSINLLTLLALVLAIGLVVDDAIVVVENIYRHIEEGMTPKDAALQGAREITGPVISMTITLACVYAPIGFVSGLTGALFREFAFTLAGAVVVSGVIALTLSPMMCAHAAETAGGECEGLSRACSTASSMGCAAPINAACTRRSIFAP